MSEWTIEQEQEYEDLYQGESASDMASMIVDLRAALASERIRREEAEKQNEEMRKVLLRSSSDALHADECHSIAQGPYIDVIHNDVPCDCGLDALISSLETPK